MAAASSGWGSLRLVDLVLWTAAGLASGGAPPQHARIWTSYDWCDCRSGLANVTVWPAGQAALARVVAVGEEASFLAWPSPVAEVEWLCDGMASAQRSAGAAAAVWSLRAEAEVKGPCGSTSGRLKWNGWAASDRWTSVPFSSGSDGYACLKIPALLRTRAGTWLAFAGSKRLNCKRLTSTFQRRTHATCTRSYSTHLWV